MTISPTNTRFNAIKTNKTGLQNTSVTNGSVYFVADTQELFFDFDSQRVKVTDILILPDEASRTSILFSPLNKFYFVLATQKLYLYKDGTWYTVSGAGGGVVVDDELSTISVNPVQNNVITNTLNTKQTIANLVTTITSSSTDATYPSAKCVYDAIADAEYDVEVVSDTDGDVIIEGVTSPTPSNFIPKGTIINVKTDGTGDFTKLSDAISYLTGKWSNGNVQIQLGSGTFSSDSKIVINGSNFNIPLLLILGTGMTTTIIETSVTGTEYMFSVQNCKVELSNIKFINTNGTKLGRGIVASRNSHLVLTNVHSANVSDFGIGASQGGETYLSNSVALTDVNAGIFTEQGATVKTSWGCQINATNVSTLFNVMSGIIYASYPTLNLTNVTTTYSQTNRSITNNGLIMVCTN